MSAYHCAITELGRDSKQWSAYSSKGHCVVLAGPGSGKTKTLTTKLARMLKEDVLPPRGIACITYSNECARELESRLEQLGVGWEKRLFVGTVHSFAMTQIILPYAKLVNLGLSDDFKVADKRERDRAIERAYADVVGDGGNPHDAVYSMNTYRRSILDRESDEWRDTDPQKAHLVEAYERELRELGCIDFEDMPLLGLKALEENDWLRKALFAKYPILVVDEYQDLGAALHQIVLSLCFSEGVRLFAVGDVDQCIYGFCGAKPQNLLDLAAREDVETVRLRFNYRCASRIVSASGYALGDDRGYVCREGAEEGRVFFWSVPGRYEIQASQLVRQLIPDIFSRNEGVSYGDIAILYPAAWIGNTLAQAAQDNDIPVIRADKNSIYPRSNRILRWLEKCALWCCGGWNSGLPKFSSIANEGRKLLYEVVITDDEFSDFQKDLVSFLWSRKNPDLLLRDWLNDLDRTIMKPCIDKCKSLRDDYSVFAKFQERTLVGGDCDELSLGYFAGQGNGSDCLHLSTLHSSKGCEYKVVIMFGMDVGGIPRSQAGRVTPEERRLFYVGVTRAKTELHMVSTRGRTSPLVTEVDRRINEQKVE